ncbi:hypothetical protein D3C73_952560 [compost metagenome]
MLDVAVFGGHVAGWKNVGEEQDLFVAQAVRHNDRANIGIRNAKILRLTAWEATIHFGITEQAGGRIADRLCLLRACGVRSFAQRNLTPFALPALTAGNCEGHYDAIADLEFGIAAADFNDLPHRLMAHDVPRMHAGNEAAVEMQIGAANRAAGHLDDRVAIVLDYRVVYRFAAYVAATMPRKSFHLRSLPIYGRSLPQSHQGNQPPSARQELAA